jgi:dephospho-CoA kinase
MLKVGLTGGLASGKTYIASCFEGFGAHVAYADQFGHEALRPTGEAYAEVIREFGMEILDRDGFIDRPALGAIVFADQEQLKKLNAFVHPHVFQREEAFFEQVARQDPRGVAVIEAAIMIEIGSYKRYDRIVLADCSLETQIERFMERNKASREQALARIQRQMPLEEKRQYADYGIDTSEPMPRTKELARAVYVKLKEEAA